MSKMCRINAEKITAICAVIALILAASQIYFSNQNSRQIEAMSAYREYLSLAIENPDMTNGIPAEEKLKDKYEWFVSYLLNSAEQIVTSSAYDSAWEQTLLDQFCLHHEYLQSERFQPQRQHYAIKLTYLLDQAAKRCS